METHSHRSMSQRIFQLDLPMETVSLYLLCCGLSDEGMELSIGNIQSVWNSSEDTLENSLAQLLEKNILSRPKNTDVQTYKLVTPAAWLSK